MREIARLQTSVRDTEMPMPTMPDPSTPPINPNPRGDSMTNPREQIEDALVSFAYFACAWLKTETNHEVNR